MEVEACKHPKSTSQTTDTGHLFTQEEGEGLYDAWKSGWKAEKEKAQEADDSKHGPVTEVENDSPGIADAFQGGPHLDHNMEGHGPVTEVEDDSPGIADAFQGTPHLDYSKEGAANLIDAQFAGEPEPPSRAWGSKTPDTIIASPEGPPDFNGEDAIIARHPDVLPLNAPISRDQQPMHTLLMRGIFIVGKRRWC